MTKLNKNQILKLPKNQLKSYLHAYLLASDASPMANVIDNILKAYLFKQHVIIHGEPLSSLYEIIEVLQALIIPFKALESSHYDTVHEAQAEYPKSILIEAPRDEYRLADYGLLVPYYLEYHQRELGKNAWVRINQFDVLILPVLLGMMFHKPNIRLCDLVHTAIIHSKKGRVTSDYLIAADFGSISRIYEELYQFDPRALNYLGIDITDDIRMRHYLSIFTHSEHPINKMTVALMQMDRDGQSHDTDYQKDDSYYFMAKRQFFVRPRDINAVVNNFLYLKKRNCDRKTNIVKIILLRLKEIFPCSYYYEN